MRMLISLSPWKVVALLALLLAGLVAADVVLQRQAYNATGSLDYMVHWGFAEPQPDVEYPSWLMEEIRLRFDLDQENNFPTWFASSLLLLSAVVLAAIGVSVRRAGSWFWVHWWLLAAVFVVLSADESVRLHELLGGREGSPGTSLLKELGLVGNVYFYFDWVLAGAAFAIILALLYMPLVVRLPLHVMAILTVAVGVYLAGVLGLEAVSAKEAWEQGSTWRYHKITVVEESLEGAGILLGMFGLLTYLRWLGPTRKATKAVRAREPVAAPSRHERLVRPLGTRGRAAHPRSLSSVVGDERADGEPGGPEPFQIPAEEPEEVVSERS